MTKYEADMIIEEQMKELKARADKAESDSDFIALTDAILAVYVLMYNSKSFDGAAGFNGTDTAKLN